MDRRGPSPLLPEPPTLRRCEQSHLVSLTEGHTDQGTHKPRDRQIMESTLAWRDDVW